MKKEYKVGQIVTINGTKCRVTKENSCTGCILADAPVRECLYCSGLARHDGNSVIFKPITSKKEKDTYKVKKSDLKGRIKDFPIEVVQRMVNCQVEQGNKADVKIFQLNPDVPICDGFDWEETSEGYSFWHDVIYHANFNLFFKKHPISKAHKASDEEIGITVTKRGNSVLDAKETSEFQLPPKNMQVWIRGNKERGKDVIKMLTDLGAENPSNYLGDDVNTIYSIDKYNQINWLDIHSNTASLIANFYKEIKLPWNPKDKELVWAWDNGYSCGRFVKFYDNKHHCTYDFTGDRGGFSYDNYAPYEGTYPEWAKEELLKLKD